MEVDLNKPNTPRHNVAIEISGVLLTHKHIKRLSRSAVRDGCAVGRSSLRYRGRSAYSAIWRRVFEAIVEERPLRLDRFGKPATAFETTISMCRSLGLGYHRFVPDFSSDDPGTTSYPSGVLPHSPLRFSDELRRKYAADLARLKITGSLK